MTAAQQTALRTAQALIDLGHSREAVLNGPFIPVDLRQFVRDELGRDENVILTPARSIVANTQRSDWLQGLDRSTWIYWPALRQYLLAVKHWNPSDIRSLDDSSDRILRQLEPPDKEKSDVRGLVLGYVQSGKTASFTALIAKAADAGYRLVIVLSGIDKGLRRQTNLRLKRELVGYPDNPSGCVRMPGMGHQWHEFTTTDKEGDFDPGCANHAALQGSQPVLLVVKKNGAVLRRLRRWLDDAPPEVRRTLPLLVVDDEADQASVDTRGTYQTEDGPLDPDYEPPSVINGLIRDLLQRFEKRAYVAYTATPFANILVPHDTIDPRVGNDLYPKDFIIDLPKPRGYFGAEEFFGRFDRLTGEHIHGLDVIRSIAEDDIATLNTGGIPPSLQNAVLDFVLGGAARAQRGQSAAPATMLVHTSQRIAEHSSIRILVSNLFSELRDEWRYQRSEGIRERLRVRWESEFRSVTQASHPDRDVPFDLIEEFVGPFFEAVQVREVNSYTGEVLDYDREPELKAIAIGGNRLARGLTLEGLLVSFFIRESKAYDTLMQMGRWFGYRGGYEDLTRIHTTTRLAEWFNDLAFVEHRLREDIDVYESQGLTPYEVGLRIWQHPTMQVTGPLKRRFASDTIIQQSYSLELEQTFKFPFSRPEDLAIQAEANTLAVRDFIRRLGVHDTDVSKSGTTVWTGVSPNGVVEFLRSFRRDDEAQDISIPLICAYIEKMVTAGELTRWTVAVSGLQSEDLTLGQADWGLPTGHVNQVSRSRLNHIDSIGVVVEPDDEAIALKTELRGKAARRLRPAEEGLLILYPISRHSRSEGGNRRPLYENPNDPLARDLVGLALSFPQARQPQPVEAYLEGTAGWRPVD
jgi:hypothetical protein